MKNLEIFFYMWPLKKGKSKKKKKNSPFVMKNL